MEKRHVIHVIDPDARNRAQFSRVLFNMGHHAEVYEDVGELTHHLPRKGIILARDNGEDGCIARLMRSLSDRGTWLPVIAMGEDPDLGQVVEAMRAGAFDYLPQPIDEEALQTAIMRVARESRAQAEYRRRASEARLRIALLSTREREVLDHLSKGFSNKAIARELDISPRTVEIHRGNMMDKLGARHAAEAVRLRLEASMEEWLH